jgi:hypothetical protein
LLRRAVELAPEDPVLANLQKSLQPAAEIASRPVDGDRQPPEDAGEEPMFATATVAELCLRQGHHEKALAIYRELHRAQPDDASIMERLAHVEALHGANADAVVDEPPSDASGAISAEGSDDPADDAIATLQQWLVAIQARREHVQKHFAEHC